MIIIFLNVMIYNLLIIFTRVCVEVVYKLIYIKFVCVCVYV